MSENIPKHIAIIMDGNGRWAQKRGLPRIAGHEKGGQQVETIVEAAFKAGIRHLTLYAFSKENWNRPKPEVDFLMALLGQYLDRKMMSFIENDMVFNTIGDLTDLPDVIQDKIADLKAKTLRNKGLTVTFAFSYSSRHEITQACRDLARLAAEGEIQPDAIDEKMISNHLYTANLPDPDLLIRTSGEMRISNFLLWQISYAELYFTEKCWPDFSGEDLVKAIESYKKRDRRFGRTEKMVL